MPEVQYNHDGVCLSCASGKKSRGPFPFNKSKTNDILQLIYFDLCGTMLVKYLGGYLYYITFMDEFSQKTWIFYLKYKDEAFEMFHKFKALIENQIGKMIKVFRSNNGGEYTSNEFIKVRIKKTTMVPYNPEQNGGDERKNKAIMEFA